ncbi:MAG: MinD/ParA family protein [Schwartzia sp.]|nr:MinD/ParA family protein [Schwartzia sp. (in: firmicutes)]MBR1885325.1 MinD/ParA family protein [Schwartzia sp. (in: firmicutes)]
MKDQASSLRELVQEKNEYNGPQAVPPAAQPPSVVAVSPEGEPQTVVSTYKRVFRPTIRTRARVIAITSGKGGVGKTNLTVNLAIAMGKIGRRVMIVDADLGMANVDVVLGTVSKHHLLHLLQPEVNLEDVLIHGPFGVNYISGGSAIERAVDFTPQERQCLMDKLTACETMADIVLVDTGAGLGRNVLDFILAADEVILVTTPEPTALTDAYAVMKAYSMHSEKKDLKIVVNRVYDEEESNEVVMKLRRTSEKFLSMSLTSLGMIYEDRSVMNAVKRQSPLLAAYPDAMAARCIEAVAKNILYGGDHEIRLGWRGFLQKLLNFS